jgi:hypothetical protein
MGGVVVAMVVAALIGVISLSRGALDSTNNPQGTEDVWSAPTATPNPRNPRSGRAAHRGYRRRLAGRGGRRGHLGGYTDDQDYSGGSSDDGDSYDEPTPKPTPVNNYRKASADQIEDLQCG